jgi:hypothetical protein
MEWTYGAQSTVISIATGHGYCIDFVNLRPRHHLDADDVGGTRNKVNAHGIVREISSKLLEKDGKRKFLQMSRGK